MRSAWQWHGRFYLPHNVDDLLFDLVSQQSWFCLIFYYYFQRTFLHLLHGLIPFFFSPEYDQRALLDVRFGFDAY